MTGYLEGLRKNWRIHANPMPGASLLTSQNFIDRFGKTALFLHVGVDRHPASFGTNPHYKGQIYAVFLTGEKGKLVPFTPLELDHLASTLRDLKPGYPDYAATMAHLVPHISAAVSNIKAHQSTLAWLNPPAAHFMAKFNGG